jgi:hypothetical protein
MKNKSPAENRNYKSYDKNKEGKINVKLLGFFIDFNQLPVRNQFKKNEKYSDAYEQFNNQ